MVAFLSLLQIGLAIFPSPVVRTGQFLNFKFDLAVDNLTLMLLLSIGLVVFVTLLAADI